MRPLLALCLALALACPAAAVGQNDPDYAPPADDARCNTCDGLHLLSMGEYGRAMHVFQLLGAKGDLFAANEVGVMYEEGLGVPVDYDRARAIYTGLANAGDSVGLASLARMYEKGHGVVVDERQAAQDYRLATTAAHADGLSYLALTYEDGIGVAVDYRQALRLYHEAIATSGDSLAMEDIGYMLQNGHGVAPNPSEAWCWYTWADANGQPNASVHLAELAAAGHEPTPDCSAVFSQGPAQRQYTAAR